MGFLQGLPHGASGVWRYGQERLEGRALGPYEADIAIPFVYTFALAF